MSIYHKRNASSSSIISSQVSTRATREGHSGSVLAKNYQQFEGNLYIKAPIEESVCMKSLLTIVARGSAIITELHRLIELVPSPFKHSETNPLVTHYLDEEKKFSYDDLICDFSYFKEADKFEEKIEANLVLKKADEQLCDNIIDILTRFYLTFESILRFANELNNLVSELEAETFVGQDLESLLQDNEGRQLLCEAYFLLGYMLITVDNNFEGHLRERLIVGYYRYSSYKSTPDSNLDDTCNLLRNTGFRASQQQIYRTSNVVSYYRPEGYPENFFSRVAVNQSVVNLLVAKLQTVDIYNQTVMTFPNPEHRSTALSQQASMLYVILYFCPEILNFQKSRMREITDKFFYDNWIISIHMGELVNLIEAWSPYRAAKESLVLLLEVDSTQNLVAQYNKRFFRVSNQLEEYLKEGWLSESSVLENHTRILNQIRDANVILKWMLLQSRTQVNWRSRLSKIVNSIVCTGLPDSGSLYKFLQNLAEVERKFSLIYDGMIENREKRINESKTKALETFGELVDIFNGKKPMRWIQPANSRLVELLEGCISCLNSIDFERINARDLIINLINEMESVQESYSDGKNLQVVQLFTDTKDSLLEILRSLSLTNDIKILLHSICDFSYAWKIMDSVFTTQMQQIIKDNPLTVNGIESTFLKLASAFDICLIRIQQVDSQDDLISVSQYYSSKLVSYIRDVLHVIPATILELLSSIISIQTEYVMGDMPSKVSIEGLKDYALPEKRFQMLELTYKVSLYAESMLMMEDTTIGLIRINSKKLLEDGIRRELVKRMSDSIQQVLEFPEYPPNQAVSNIYLANNLLSKLQKLDSILKGYKRSFEYIQDYLFIYGLRMWQEELSRIIKFNTEQAIEVLLSKSGMQNELPATVEHLSLYQSTKAPIPIYSSNPLRSSFILRLLNELLTMTNPRSTIYDEQMSAWYEQKPQHEKVLDLKIFELLASSLSITGLNGLDQLCCTLLMIELKKLDNFLIASTSNSSLHCQGLVEAVNSISTLAKNFKNYNQQTANRLFSSLLTKVAPFSDKIVNHLLCIGQLQAIRSSISYVSSTKCRYEARNLYSCLETLNSTLLSTLSYGRKSIQHKKSLQREQRNVSLVSDETNSKGTPENEEEELINLEDSQLMFELTNHLEWIGLSDPMSKIYTLALKACNSSYVYEFREKMVSIDIIFLVLLEQCSKFHFSRSISGFVPKQSKSFYDQTYTIDGQPLFYGLVTFLNHFEPFLSVLKEKESSSQVKVHSLNRLLLHMSLYVKCLLDDESSFTCLKAQYLTLEVVNMILSMVELSRLSRQPIEELLSSTFLPKYLLDTFQFTVCHLKNSNNGNNNNSNNT